MGADRLAAEAGAGWHARCRRAWFSRTSVGRPHVQLYLVSAAAPLMSVFVQTPLMTFGW